jgi:putative PIN family toxin of toxin-antitoxin system
MPVKNKITRVVIDTNIWVSFLISDKYKRLDTLLWGNRTIILFSTELLEELNKVSKYPKLRKYFPPYAVEEMIANLGSYIELVRVTSKTDICRDPNDNFLLSLAKDGKANFLITGDTDLLSLTKFNKTKILTLTDFLTVTSKNFR